MDFIKKTDYQDIAYSIDLYASYLNYSSPFHFFYSNPRFGCLGLYIYIYIYTYTYTFNLNTCMQRSWHGSCVFYTSFCFYFHVEFSQMMMLKIALLISLEALMSTKVIFIVLNLL
jgi:hypothetical protein